jgi:hypothetical protein
MRASLFQGTFGQVAEKADAQPDDECQHGRGGVDLDGVKGESG